MDIQRLQAEMILFGGLTLIGLPFLFFGDKPFWPLAVLMVVVGSILLAAFSLLSMAVTEIFGYVLPLLLPLVAGGVILLLAGRQREQATRFLAPPAAGTILVLHVLMLYTKGQLLMALVIIGMGGGIPFVLNSLIGLFFLGAAAGLALAWKQPRWARVGVCTLFGMLLFAFGLMLPVDLYITSWFRYDPYLLGLALALPVAALGIYAQARRLRRPVREGPDATMTGEL